MLHQMHLFVLLYHPPRLQLKFLSMWEWTCWWKEPPLGDPDLHFIDKLLFLTHLSPSSSLQTSHLQKRLKWRINHQVRNPMQSLLFATQARKTELLERKRGSWNQHLLRGNVMGEQKFRIPPVFAGSVAIWCGNSLWWYTLNLRGKRLVWVWVSVPTGQLWSHGAFPFPSAPLTACQIAHLKPTQAMDHISLDPSFPRQLLNPNTGHLHGSFLHFRVPFLPWRSLACDQTLWLEALPVVIQTCPLIPATTGISYSSALKGIAWPNIKENSQENINTRGIMCWKDGKQSVESDKEVLLETILLSIYILIGWSLMNNKLHIIITTQYVIVVPLKLLSDFCWFCQVRFSNHSRRALRLQGKYEYFYLLVLGVKCQTYHICHW